MISPMQGCQILESLINEEELFIFNSKGTWKMFFIACGREPKITADFCYYQLFAMIMVCVYLYYAHQRPSLFVWCCYL